MRILRARRTHSRVITKYFVEMVDREGNQVSMTLCYNRKDKKYRPQKVIVNGTCYRGKLRFLLDRNALHGMLTEVFIERICRKVNSLIKQKQARKIATV